MVYQGRTVMGYASRDLVNEADGVDKFDFETKLAAMTAMANGEEEFTAGGVDYTLDEDGNIVLGDEVLTPDSSRFWPLEGYEAGKPQPSYDKQFVRDWLKANPDSDYKLPQDVIDKTIAKYVEAYKMITGKDLD